MTEYNSRITPDDLEKGIKDEFNVIYSADGKRLLKCQDTLLKEYKVHEGTEIICDDAFHDTTPEGNSAYTATRFKITRIILPDSIKVIGNDAFRYSHLQEINFCEGLIHIGKKAFFATSLSTIQLPDSLLSISDYAFGELYYLKQITIPRSVREMGQAPFTNSYHLDQINVDPNNTYFTIHNEFLCDIDKARLVQSPATKTDMSDIAPSVIRCDIGAFCMATDLDSIPQIIKNRWRLQRMKDILISLTDRPYGTIRKSPVELGTVISVKLSNNSFCNVTYSCIDGDDKLLVSSQTDLLTLLNALGYRKIEIAEKFGIIEKIKISKRNRRFLEGKTLAQDVIHNWIEEFVDEDTGEVESIPRREVVFSSDTTIDEDRLDFIDRYLDRKNGEAEILVYKDSSECYPGNYYYHYYIKHANEASQDDAIDLTERDIPHLSLISYLEHKDELFNGILKGYLPFDVEEATFSSTVSKPAHKCPICTFGEVDWREALTKFFDRETMKIGSEMISNAMLWYKLERYLAAYYTPRGHARHFRCAFAFLFEKYSDAFTEGPTV